MMSLCVVINVSHFSMGYCILVVQGCISISRAFHRHESEKGYQRKWPGYVLIGILLLLATKTINRNMAWYSRETLFR